MTITEITVPDANNQGRRGRPFSMRLSDDERRLLNEKAAEARRHMPYVYGNGRLHGSVAHFLIWCAMQWAPPKPADQEDEFVGADVAKLRRPRKAKAGRRRSGTTGRRRPTKRPAKAKAKAKAKRGGRK
jgi:hypothetical protein